MSEAETGPYQDDLDALLEDELADAGMRAAYDDAAARAAAIAALTHQRKTRQITQRDVARTMGTTQSAVSDLEAGGSDPRLSTLQRYARAIGSEFRFEIGAIGAPLVRSWDRRATRLDPIGERQLIVQLEACEMDWSFANAATAPATPQEPAKHPMKVLAIHAAPRVPIG